MPVRGLSSLSASSQAFGIKQRLSGYASIEIHVPHLLIVQPIVVYPPTTEIKPKVELNDPHLRKN